MGLGLLLWVGLFLGLGGLFGEVGCWGESGNEGSLTCKSQMTFLYTITAEVTSGEVRRGGVSRFE